MADLLDTGVRKATLVRAPRERVYDAFTTAEGLDGWFTTGASVDPRPGGSLVFRWRDWGPDKVAAEDECRVIDARRPERFVFAEHPDAEGPPTAVEITFTAAPEGPVVRLSETGFQNTERGRRALAAQAGGWGEALTLLKFYVEHGLRY